MPDAASPINRLRRVTQAMIDGNPVSADDAAWFVAGATRYETEAGMIGLDAALGLGSPGRRGWWTIEKLQARDAALVAFRRERLRDLTDTQAAIEINRLARRRASVLQPIYCYAEIPAAKQLVAILRKSASPVHFRGKTSGPAI